MEAVLRWLFQECGVCFSGGLGTRTARSSQLTTSHSANVGQASVNNRLLKTDVLLSDAEDCEVQHELYPYGPFVQETSVRAESVKKRSAICIALSI